VDRLGHISPCGPPRSELGVAAPSSLMRMTISVFSLFYVLRFPVILSVSLDTYFVSVVLTILALCWKVPMFVIWFICLFIFPVLEIEPRSRQALYH
jgi:hypothetical protein